MIYDMHIHGILLLQYFTKNARAIVLLILFSTLLVGQELQQQQNVFTEKMKSLPGWPYVKQSLREAARIATLFPALPRSTRLCSRDIFREDVMACPRAAWRP